MSHRTPSPSLGISDGLNCVAATSRATYDEPRRATHANVPEKPPIVLSERERELLRVFSCMLIVSLSDQVRGLNTADPAEGATISAVAAMTKSVGTVYEQLTSGQTPAITPRDAR